MANDETRAAAKENCDECGKDLPSWVASNIHGTFCSTGCIEAATARGRAKQRTDQRAELARLRAEVAEFGKLMVVVSHNGDGDTQEIPATPDSLRAYVDELQNEWDAAEMEKSRLRAANAELAGELDELVQAVVTHVNAKGAGGFLLARLADVKPALARHDTGKGGGE